MPLPPPALSSLARTTKGTVRGALSVGAAEGQFPHPALWQCLGKEPQSAGEGGRVVPPGGSILLLHG